MSCISVSKTAALFRLGRKTLRCEPAESTSVNDTVGPYRVSACSSRTIGYFRSVSKFCIDTSTRGDLFGITLVSPSEKIAGHVARQ